MLEKKRVSETINKSVIKGIFRVIATCPGRPVDQWQSKVPHNWKMRDMLLLLSTPLHQRAASRVQHPKSCGSQQSLPPGGKERLHFVGIRPEVQARKGGW